jgi:hypothetical protein
MNQTQNMSHKTAFAIGLMLDATDNQCNLEMDLYFREWHLAKLMPTSPIISMVMVMGYQTKRGRNMDMQFTSLPVGNMCCHFSANLKGYLIMRQFVSLVFREMKPERIGKKNGSNKEQNM